MTHNFFSAVSKSFITVTFEASYHLDGDELLWRRKLALNAQSETFPHQGQVWGKLPNKADIELRM